MNEKNNFIIFNKEKIKMVMPHDDPFLFLDEVRLRSNDTAIGKYHITGNEYFLKGHFKTTPVFPASIMMEALGQLAVFALLKIDNMRDNINFLVNNEKIMFVSSDYCSCHRVCKPKDILDLSVTISKIRPPFIKFKDCNISCKKEKVFRANEISLVFNFKSKNIN